MKIPVYDEPKVQTQGALAPDASPFVYQAQDQVARGLAEAGHDLGKSAERVFEQVRHHATDVENIATTRATQGFIAQAQPLLIGDSSNTTTQQGFLDTTGDAALRDSPAVREAIDKLFQQQVESISDPHLRQKFLANAFPVYNSMLVKIEQHVGDQRDLLRQKAIEGGRVALLGAATSGKLDPAALRAQFNALKDSMLADPKHFGAKTVEQLQEELGLAAVRGFLSRPEPNLAAAKAYLEEHREEMGNAGPKAYELYQRALARGNLRGTNEKLINDVAGGIKGASDGDGVVNEAAARRSIQEWFAQRVEKKELVGGQRDAYMHEFETQMTSALKMRKAIVNQAKSQLVGALATGKPPGDALVTLHTYDPGAAAEAARVQQGFNMRVGSYGRATATFNAARLYDAYIAAGDAASRLDIDPQAQIYDLAAKGAKFDENTIVDYLAKVKKDQERTKNGQQAGEVQADAAIEREAHQGALLEWKKAREAAKAAGEQAPTYADLAKLEKNKAAQLYTQMRQARERFIDINQREPNGKELQELAVGVRNGVGILEGPVLPRAPRGAAPAQPPPPGPGAAPAPAQAPQGPRPKTNRQLLEEALARDPNGPKADAIRKKLGLSK